VVRTALILLLNPIGFRLEIITLVSSANNIGLANVRMVVEKSFIYIKNNRGPSTEPWGTPCFTCTQFEEYLFMHHSFIP
jgi:hypothetical protein